MRAGASRTGAFNVTGGTGLAVKVGNLRIPMISAPTGTMANNGAITLGTALDATYTDCYLFLPAGAVAAGVPAAASWLYCQMSSTTAGVVFNNTYTTGEPTVPASPTAFATTGPGAYTGDTTEQGVIFTLQIVNAGAKFYIDAYQKENNSAGAKTGRLRLNGAGGTAILTSAQTTVTDVYHDVMMVNVTQAKQRANFISFQASTFAMSTLISAAIDMSAATDIRWTCQKAVATDWVGIMFGSAFFMQ